MAHAIWTGAISFGLVTIPVKLYSAIREHELHFKYLHRKDEGRIRYERVCSVCGEKVPWNEIARGFEVQKGDYVILDDEDFAKASPESTQSVDIVEFVDLEEIDPVLFDVPYYLEPEKRGRHAYALLRDTLASTGKVGIARVVMRTREHLSALKPRGPALVIEMMHWADEVVAPTDLEFPEPTVKLSQPELKMATALVESMTTRFDPGQFEDHYRDQLMHLIEARAQGKPAPRGKARPRAATNVVDLVDVLQKSLASARKASHKPHGRRHRAA
ncbi:MAG TPA: Ku protein [Polyangiaceae bacterium]